MSVRSSLFHHIVVSIRNVDEECLNILKDYFFTKVDEYIIGKELGANNHPHLDAYVKFKKEMRPDAISRSLKTLLKHKTADTAELKNIKVCINTIDSDPRYGYGYSAKEGSYELYNLTEEYIQESIQYYNDHIIKSKEPPKQCNIDTCTVDYFEYITKNYEAHPTPDELEKLYLNYQMMFATHLTGSQYQRFSFKKAEEHMSLMLKCHYFGLEKL